MANTKIVITDEIVADSLSAGRSITDVLGEKYEGEIADRISNDSRNAKLDPLQMALMDANISKRSPIMAFYDSSSSTSSWLFPAWVDKRLTETIAKNNIQQYICKNVVTTPSRSVNGATIDLTDTTTKEQLKKARVAPGADLPIAKVGVSENATTLYKVGRAIESTYEDVMYQTVDLFGKTIDYIANDVANQQVLIALDVLATLNSANNKTWSSGETSLTAARLVKFGLEYFDGCGIPMTTIIAPMGAYTSMALMNISDANTEKATPTLTFDMPQGILGNVKLIYSNDVAKISSAERIIALNSDYSLVKYVAQGSMIREIDKNIRNQTNIGTISEISGFAKLVEKATLSMKQAAS